MIFTDLWENYKLSNSYKTMFLGWWSIELSFKHMVGRYQKKSKSQTSYQICCSISTARHLTYIFWTNGVPMEGYFIIFKEILKNDYL